MSALVPYEERKLARQEQLAHIYGEVASGRSLDSILRQDPGMPLPKDFWLWHMDDPDIRDNLARARENGIEALMDRAQDIAENPVEAVELMEEIGPDGTKRRRTVREALGHRRLLIDTYVRRAQMLAPRKYGPRVAVDAEVKVDDLTQAIARGTAKIMSERGGR